MVSLRQFAEHDAAVIREKWMFTASTEEICRMIKEWKSRTFEGKYFEMLALTANDAVVGCVSLYEKTAGIASVGVEVFAGERGKGYAAEGVRLMLENAKRLGYRIIQDQVSADNAASIALHKKLGFETDGYLYVNARNRQVLLFLLCLS